MTKLAIHLRGRDSFQNCIHYLINLVIFCFLSDYFSDVITHQYAKKSNAAFPALLKSLRIVGLIRMFRKDSFGWHNKRATNGNDFPNSTLFTKNPTPEH